MKKLLKYFKALILFFVPKILNNELILKEKNKNNSLIPYVINVINNGDLQEKNIEILGSNDNLHKGFTECGSLIIGSVEISSGLPNVQYAEMLFDFLIKPVCISTTYVQSETINQVLENIYINYKDNNGKNEKKKLGLNIDYTPLQYNISIHQNYLIDGSTKLIIEKIAPKTTVVIILYPAITEVNFSKLDNFILWLNKK